MNVGSAIILCVRSKNFSRGRIVEANCIFESTPPPHFGLDVVYEMGGRINGTLRYTEFTGMRAYMHARVTGGQWKPFDPKSNAGSSLH